MVWVIVRVVWRHLSERRSLSRKIVNIYKTSKKKSKTILRKSFLDIYKCPKMKSLRKSWKFELFVTIKKVMVWSLEKDFSVCERNFLSFGNSLLFRRFLYVCNVYENARFNTPKNAKKICL